MRIRRRVIRMIRRMKRRRRGRRRIRYQLRRRQITIIINIRRGNIRHIRTIMRIIGRQIITIRRRITHRRRRQGKHEE